MRLLAAFVLLVACGLRTGILAEEDVVYGPTVRVNQGLVSGRKELSLKGKEFYSYRAVPYAKPPVGELRFKDPVSIESWEGTLDGTKHPERCLQNNMFKRWRAEAVFYRSGSEDCLYLNVFTPKPNEELAGLPVMVYVHGGGFVYGSVEDYPPYVLMSEGIVLVVIQYRLGVLGFLSTEDAVLPGNNGLKDQTQSLRWVQENIRHFGGDPGRVTIFGESAGAGSVHMHMLSPYSKGLFHWAIAQSGTALCPWAFHQNHRELADELGDAFGCSLVGGSETYVECMQKIDADELVEYAEKKKWVFSPTAIVPRVDGDFFPSDPVTLIREGRYNKVNAIFGITKDEGGFFAPPYLINQPVRDSLNSDFDNKGPLTLFMTGEEQPEIITKKIYQYYLNRTDVTITPEDGEQMTRMLSEGLFVMGYDSAALLHLQDEDDLSLYLYEFQHKGERGYVNFFFNTSTTWVSHGDDVLYLFEGGGLLADPLTREDDLKMRDIMVAAWTNFAKTGNPNVPKADFIWQRATRSNFRFLSFDTNPHMESDKRQDVREFWYSLGLKQVVNPFEDLEKEMTSDEVKDTKKEELFSGFQFYAHKKQYG